MEVLYTLFEVCKNFNEIYLTFQLFQAAHWAKTDYSLSAGLFAVLPEVKVIPSNLQNARFSTPIDNIFTSSLVKFGCPFYASFNLVTTNKLTTEANNRMKWK